MIHEEALYQVYVPLPLPSSSLQRLSRTLRRVNPASRFLSSADVKPHQAGAAYIVENHPFAYCSQRLFVHASGSG